jgi:acetyltransferase-like isoleucine patch superfamily enzyme
VRNLFKKIIAITNRFNKTKPFITNKKLISKSAKIELKFGGQIYIAGNTEVLEGVIIQTYGGLIQIGKNCSINSYTIIYGHGGVKIGDNVLIAHL